MCRRRANVTGCLCSLKYKNGLPVVNWHLKRILFSFNFLSWIFGLFALGVGIYAKLDKSFQATKVYIDPTTPIILIGAVIFIITFFGFVGALRENLCMLRFFCIALSAVLLLELVGSLVALTMSGYVRERVEEYMYMGIVHYRDDPDVQNIVDWGQEEFQCCGVHSVQDWSHNMYFNCMETRPVLEKCGVPYSCCLPQNDTVINTLCGMNIQSMNMLDIHPIVHTEGCLNALVAWLHDNMFNICIVFIGLGCIPQIVGILISRILVIQIKDQEFYTAIGLLNPRGELQFL